MVEPTPLKPKPTKKSKFPPGFAPGATCKLKSGGALVSITDMLDGLPLAVQCAWVSADGYVQEHSFPISCLRLATETELSGTVDEADATEEP